jgi:RNA polymerase sigma-70 factor (ECF subfamily)
MSNVPIDAREAGRLYEQAGAARWRVPREAFHAALEASAAHGLAGRDPSGADVARYLRGLRLEDLALACACAVGEEDAWEHFVREYRPVLYRAAEAIDPAGGARELADALYGDLFGTRTADGARQSLFRYFHGRSSLATWLRAVLSQRHVDRIRSRRRTEPLPDDESPSALPARETSPNPDRARLLACLNAALASAVATLDARDRLRLASYYARNLTLAQIGRLLGEHEATVSRHLTRIRREIRRGVESQLREVHGLDEATIGECFAAVEDDPGQVDVAAIMERVPVRKIDAPQRSRS